VELCANNIIAVSLVEEAWVVEGGRVVVEELLATWVRAWQNVQVEEYTCCQVWTLNLKGHVLYTWYICRYI
jgi:hypothetical protein